MKRPGCLAPRKDTKQLIPIRVEAMVEGSAKMRTTVRYPPTAPIVGHLSAHTLGLTLRVYRPAHRHQTTRGARLCERPPLPPQV